MLEERWLYSKLEQARGLVSPRLYTSPLEHDPQHSRGPYMVIRWILPIFAHPVLRCDKFSTHTTSVLSQHVYRHADMQTKV